MRVADTAVAGRKRRLRGKVDSPELIGDRLGAHVVGLGLVRGVVQQTGRKHDARRREHEPTDTPWTHPAQHSAHPYKATASTPTRQDHTDAAVPLSF